MNCYLKKLNILKSNINKKNILREVIYGKTS